MNNCLLIGDPDSVAAFAMAGVYVRSPASQAEAAVIFKEALKNPELAIVIITEGFAGQLLNEISQHRQAGGTPYVIEIPENLSGVFGGQSLLESIRSAVGISI